MKTAGKIALAVLLAACALTISAIAAYYIVTAGAKLDKNKLINYGQTITFYDDEGEKIDASSLEGNRSSVAAEDLKDYTKNAFIASEDRTFYSHNGLNYKRMFKALLKNIRSMSFKEGASTISQQLIKNTHLSNDKTLKRKLTEIRLTKQLERQYSKDEILEMYLNTIYFGHSCYGLQSAARFYFGRDAEDLTLSQSAVLAGLLSSPNNYSPFKNAEKCLKRRNLALKNMFECHFIDEDEYKCALAEPIGALKGNSAYPFGDYLDSASDELAALGLDCYTYLSGCKVYTYMSRQMQKSAENAAAECDEAIIITDCEGGVAAYKDDLRGAKRQPGSTIKPLIVYAPALEEGLLHTFTKIDDSPVDYNGYRPQNYDRKYHGNVTAEESLAKSYNIPAIKTLNSLTIEKAQKYAEKLHITLENEDKTLPLALGGMKYGIKLKTLCDAYSTFRQGGLWCPSAFIKRIEDKNGNTIYNRTSLKRKVFSEGTCSLMNDMLTKTAEYGTAKKLRNLPYEIAAKTGTCGDEQGNTDAYAAAYTSSHTVLVWLGDASNKKLQVTGGGECCNLLKEILKDLYKDGAPAPLERQKGTITVSIDREDYEKSGKIILSDPLSPNLNKMQVKCLFGREPQQKSTKFSSPVIQKPQIIASNGGISIVLCQTKYYSYIVKRDDKIIYDGPYSQKICDFPEKGSHVYTVTPYYCDKEGKKHFGKCCEVGQVNLSAENLILPPSITNKDWFAG